MITDILETLVYIRQLFLGISKKYRRAVYSQNYLDSSVLIAYLTTTMSSQDAITDSVLLSVISTTPGKSSGINPDTFRETLSVSTTISISFSKPIKKIYLSHTSATFKNLFYKSRRGNVNFFSVRS